MPEMPDCQIQGESFFIIEQRPLRRPKGMDSLLMRVQTDSEDSFADGGAPPEYPLMRIVEDEVTIEMPGLAYEHRLQCEGLLQDNKYEPRRRQEPAEGWDEIVETLLTTNQSGLPVGEEHPDYEHMLSVSRAVDEIGEGVYRITTTYQGIITIKPPRRVFVTDTNEVQSPAEFVVPGEVGDLPQNWVTPKLRISFTERFLFIGDMQPYYDLIGQMLEGTDIPDDVPLIAINPLDFISAVKQYNYPYGWRVDGVNAVPLKPDRTEWDVTVKYIYVPLFEAGGPAS